MKYRFRRLEAVPTLVMFAVVTLMFALGVWQLRRLEWKNALIAGIEEAQSQAPRKFLSYPATELARAEWHNVIVTGHLLNDKELHATPRFLNEQMGYAILTPLAVATPSGTEYVMVNRGWVPPDKKEARARSAGNPGGIVTIEGVLRNPLPQGLFRPDNRPDKNLWFWYDLTAMAQQTHLKLLPVLIDATRTRLKGGAIIQDGPSPFPLEIKIRNDHLGYAITWFLIGISGIVMFGIYYTERKD